MNKEKLNKTYDVLKMASKISHKYYNKPLVIADSGGKDSAVLRQCAIDCLLPNDFEVINNHTTADAPQTVYYIRDTFKKLNEQGIKATILMPNTTMWELIVKKGMPPTRLARYCCKELKETAIPNRVLAVGVRADESAGRTGREVFAVRGKTKKDGVYFDLQHTQEVFKDAEKITAELSQKDTELNAYDCTLVANAKKNNDIIVNPIYEWTDTEIWDFIHEKNIKVCDLYNMGYERVGCLFCPNATYKWKKKMEQDFPKYKENYIKAFQRMIDTKKKAGKKVDWENGVDCFNWWIQEYEHNVKGQYNLFKEE